MLQRAVMTEGNEELFIFKWKPMDSAIVLPNAEVKETVFQFVGFDNNVQPIISFIPELSSGTLTEEDQLQLNAELTEFFQDLANDSLVLEAVEVDNATNSAL